MSHVDSLALLGSSRNHFGIHIAQIRFGRIAQPPGRDKLDALAIDPCPSFGNRKYLRAFRQNLVHGNQETRTNITAIASRIPVVPRNGHVEAFQIRRSLLGGQLAVLNCINRIKRARFPVSVITPERFHLPAPRAGLALASLASCRIAQARVFQFGNDAFLKTDAHRNQACNGNVEFGGWNSPDKTVEKYIPRSRGYMAIGRIHHNLRPLHNIPVLEQGSRQLGDLGVDNGLLLVLLRALGPVAVPEKQLNVVFAFVKAIVVIVNFRHLFLLFYGGASSDARQGRRTFGEGSVFKHT